MSNMNSNDNNNVRRQTTVLIGGSNGTATLCAILGDKSNPLNAGHTIRVCTRHAGRFYDEDKKKPRLWRCNEQKAWDLVPWEVLPSSWITHVGAPDSVITYKSSVDCDELEKALSGEGVMDDGGAADLIMLCCPVNAHLNILKCVARALYRLHEKNDRLFQSDKPLVIGTLYGGGGFDWMCRVAFASERPPHFTKWNRPLSLMALKAFPYLCKSTQVGEVTLYGRYPQLVAAICPSTPLVRSHAKLLLDRMLQSGTTGKYVDFIGLSSKEALGGDGSATSVVAAASSVNAAITTKKEKTSSSTKTTNAAAAAAAAAAPTTLVGNPYSWPMADHADPHSSLGFLTCTMNCTNQFLHPGICATLFHDPQNPQQSDKDGTIPWPKNKPLPRFYGDGALAPNAGNLMVQMGVIETYPIMVCLDQLLAPSGMSPICSQHGGEPVGRMLFNFLNNAPKDCANRSGIPQMVLHYQQSKGTLDTSTYPLPPKEQVLNFAKPLSFMLGHGLSKNSRVGSVLAPVIVLPDGKIKPNVNTRFFDDDVPHGLCILLGIAELLGFSLERDMPQMLYCVRRLQHWMGKQYVLSSSIPGKRIVADAPDLHETSAPQAFGIHTLAEFQQFLKLSPFAENHVAHSEQQLFSSPIFTSRL